MVKFFSLFCCVVAAALMVGVHSDCLSIAKSVAVARSDSEIVSAFASAYGDAIVQLTEGGCSEEDAIAEAFASAQAKAVANAVATVFTDAYVKVEGDPGCFGIAEAKAGASALATAQACASAHAAAIAQILAPEGYFPLALIFAEAESATFAFEQAFTEVFSAAQVTGQGSDQDLSFDEKEIVVTAIAEAFANAIATYKGPEGESYCPL